VEYDTHEKGPVWKGVLGKIILSHLIDDTS